MGDRSVTLYGNPDGHWALLRMSGGLISPPALTLGDPPGRITHLEHLGSPADVVRQIYNQHADLPTGGRTGGSAVQEAIAAILGVSQQSVSRYILGTSDPDLSDDGWAGLVLAFFRPLTVAVRADQIIKSKQEDRHA